MLYVHMFGFYPMAIVARPAPPGLVTLVVSCALLWLLFRFDSRLPKAYHIDDVVRTSVAFFGISGVLMSIPVFNQLGRALLRAVVGGAEAVGLGDLITSNMVSVVGFAVGAFTVYLYYRNPTTGHLIAMTLGSFFLLSTEAGSQVTTWYADTIAVNVWNFIVELYIKLQEVRINLSE